MPRISAIVVTHNNRDQIAGCLGALDRSREPIDEVIVIDHASADGTTDRIRREFPRALVLGFCDNPGFGEGNNRGTRVASGDYLLLVNPDAAVEPECVGRLRAELERDSRVAIAVPKVVLEAEPSVLNSAGLMVNEVGHAWDRGYLEWDRGQFDRAEPVLAGSGCVMLVRADVFRALGGFDPAYFLYYEDLDLCWRAWIAGHRVHYVADALAMHAMKVSGRPALYNHFFDHRNRLRTVFKNMSARSLVRAAPQILLFETGTIHLVAQLQWRALWYRARAWLWNLRHVRDTLQRRRRVQRSRVVQDDELAPLFTPGRDPRVLAPVPRYRERYGDSLDAATLAPLVTMGRNDADALGLGWFEAGEHQGRTARWCSTYGIVFLASPREAGLATLRVSCASARAVTVDVRTDRESRGRFPIAAGTWQDIVVPVPLNGPVTRVELLVDGFRERDAADPAGARALAVRELALAVRA